jgi:hypothetical protein
VRPFGALRLEDVRLVTRRCLLVIEATRSVPMLVGAHVRAVYDSRDCGSEYPCSDIGRMDMLLTGYKDTYE